MFKLQKIVNIANDENKKMLRRNIMKMMTMILKNKM